MNIFYTGIHKLFRDLFLNIIYFDEQIDILRKKLFLTPNFSPKEFFNYLDINQKNFLSLTDFSDYLTNFNIPFNTYALRKLIRTYDKTNKFTINYNEFLYFITPKFPEENLQTYNNMDANEIFINILIQELKLIDKIGEITFNIKNTRNFNIYEIFMIMSKGKNYLFLNDIKNFIGNNLLKDSKIECIIYRIDLDNDKKISYKEFQEVFFPYKNYSRNSFFNQSNQTFNSYLIKNKKLNKTNSSRNINENNKNKKYLFSSNILLDSFHFCKNSLSRNLRSNNVSALNNYSKNAFSPQKTYQLYKNNNNAFNTFDSNNFYYNLNKVNQNVYNEERKNIENNTLTNNNLNSLYSSSNFDLSNINEKMNKNNPKFLDNSLIEILYDTRNRINEKNNKTNNNTLPYNIKSRNKLIKDKFSKLSFHNSTNKNSIFQSINSETMYKTPRTKKNEKESKETIEKEQKNNINKLLDFITDKIAKKNLIESIKEAICLQDDITISNLFNIFDKSNNKEIKKENFTEVCNELNIFPTDDQIFLLFKKYDLDEDNILNYEEFSNMILPMKDEYNSIIQNRENNNQNELKNSSKSYKLLKELIKAIIQVETYFYELKNSIHLNNFSLKNIWDFLIHYSSNGENLNKKEFKLFLEDNNIFLTKNETELIFNDFDLNQDGLINYNDLEREMININ